MKTGKQLYELALQYMGQKYVFGAIPDNTNPKYKGPWDCAAFTSYMIYQLTGVGIGFDKNDSKNFKKADAYTGFYKRDADAGIITVIPVEQAYRIKGALLLRYPVKGAIGHIAISDGNNGTAEAHSTKVGTTTTKNANKRDWDVGLLMPWMSYEEEKSVINPVKPAKVYKLRTPMMIDENVKTIQKALGLTGKDVDGKFGSQTSELVIAHQKKKGLIIDGAIMVGGDTAKSLNIKLTE